MNFLKKILPALLLGLAPSAWSQAENAIAADAWKLLPQVQVDGTGVYLDQVAAAAAGSRFLPHVRIARSPLVGQTAAFTRAEVAGVAQACVPGLTMTNWTGPVEARVSRRLRVFDDSDLLDLLTTTLQREYVKNRGELELHLTRPWAKPQVPDEPLTMKVSEMPIAGVGPSFVVTFELWTGKERLGNWQVPVKASVWRDIPVARSPLSRGESLKDADVALERSDVLVQRDLFLNFPPADDTLELTEGIPAGHPIFNHSVRPRPLVLRGQMVEGVFQDGALAISLMVETLEDGTLGQTVRVRNPKTRRELYGRVLNEKTVQITL